MKIIISLLLLSQIRSIELILQGEIEADSAESMIDEKDEGFLEEINLFMQEEEQDQQKKIKVPAYK